MGTDVTEVVETVQNPCSFKVHRIMCTELMKLVDSVSRILPNIEAARPRCSSGLQSLCLLNQTLDKAKLHLQYCCESSRLYLAITGDVILSRFKKSRDLLEQSLSEIQNMVPVMLAVEISRRIDDLRCATFILDSAEEEAGRIVRQLLQQYSLTSDTMENSEIKTLHLAASLLCITSPKAILIEKRSIKKLLDKVSENDPTKKKILKYLLYLLKKHGNSIMGEQMEKGTAHGERSYGIQKYTHNSLENQSVGSELRMVHGQYEPHTVDLSRGVPPEELRCPISLRLMYDPVVIASGQTYERMWIQKWFDEGNDTCPKTKIKLAHLSLTPNVAMKDLISKWCTKYGVSILDPTVQQKDLHSWEASSNSIASFGSPMNDLHLQVDLSTMSFGSLDTSYGSESSQAKTADGLNLMLMRTSDNSHAAMHDADWVLLSKLPDLQWDSQCQVIEDVKNCLKGNDQAYHFVSSDNFVDPLIKFLMDANDLHDVKAQRAGAKLLLEFVSNCRNGLLYLKEDAFSMLANFLDSEVKEEALAITEVLSTHQYCRDKIGASNAAVGTILKILDSPSIEFQQQVIQILCNLSLNSEICSQIVSLEGIPKLVPFFNDSYLAGNCLYIMENLCNTEEGMVSVVETKGCISCVSERLETGSLEEQESAVAILLSLCSQRVQYCQLVMDEGVIPPLVNISINGSENANVTALELLRLLRDINYGDKQLFGSDHSASGDTINHSKENKSSKVSGFLGMRMSVFSRPSSLVSKKWMR
ncbi:RING-type E3 ubiquitin transferase [Quillaja saponaria]|uniref:RING-type E3 ubiquitin transferase n=1 Tax=Quillaja saponaria TaxID=32244 RepID=A0AAD7L7G2_QUISA|nr:RING-type E3 ubiquitin transferase [Quillaja saponaria]